MLPILPLLEARMSITTISTTITTEVTPGAGSFAAILTIAPSGAIINASTYALYTRPTATGVTIVNFGRIITTGEPHGAIPLFGGATVVNIGTIHSSSGIYLSGGALINSGYLYGAYGEYHSDIEIKAATLANSGTINTNVDDLGGSRITNSGTILNGVFSYGGTLKNTGTLFSANGLAAEADSARLTNSGVIFSGTAGAGIFGDSNFTNSGHVWGGETGLYDQDNAQLFNLGSIGGGSTGILLKFGDVATLNAITNAGTISGGTYAILETTEFESAALHLTVDPGAVFRGAVKDDLDSGILILAGTTAGSLDMGGSFSGFSTIEFAARSSWTLGGTASELGNKAITGFAAGDTIILENFSAASEQFVSGTGFVLSNANTRATISLADDFSPAGITVTTSGGQTKITTASGTSETIANTVTIGAASYLSPFTIPSIGVIAPSAYGAAGAVALPDTDVENDGTIIGGSGSSTDQVFGAGGSGGTGITLQTGASLNNSGVIIGGQGGNAAGAGGPGGTGGAGAVLFSGAVLSNTGTITGGAGGAGGGGTAGGPGDPGTAIILQGGTVFNAGIIAGGTDSSAPARYGAVLYGGVLDNSGEIGAASATGVLVQGGTLLNSGTISGSNSVRFFNTGTLEAAPGAVFNGYISARPGFGDELVLAPGATAGSLNIGRSGGFSTIAFASGADWTLAGGSAALAAGQSITGFLPGDTISLEGFSASSYSVAAAGITLSNASASVILDANALPANDRFALTTGAAGTTLTPYVATIVNTGTITGATGAAGPLYFYQIPYPAAPAIPVGGPGGGGGAGLVLNAGTIAENTGIILGGLGGGGSPGFAGRFFGGPGGSGGYGGQGVAGSGGTLFNAGTLIGSAGGFGANATDWGDFSIAGGDGGSGAAGLAQSGAATTVINIGIILGGAAGQGGAALQSLAGGGSPGAAGLGVNISGGTLFNQGNIQGGAGSRGANATSENDYGNQFGAGGDGGTGSAGAAGLAESGAATVINTGSILGGAGGQGGASYYYYFGPNGSSKTINPSQAGSAGAAGLGVNLAGGTLFNAGFITGDGGAYVTNGILIDSGTVASTTNLPAIGFGAGTATLELYQGARLIGDAIANTAASDTLLLAGAGTATAWIGSEFQNFETISFAPGAAWTLAGNAAQLEAVPTITGFTAGDTLEIYGFSASSQTYVSGAGLELVNATASLTLNLQGAVSNGTLAGAVLTTSQYAACFLRGTRILTPIGNVPIEKLNIGDLVTTMHGDLPIRWIGRRAYAAQFIANNPNALPIRIRRHAIAFNIPSRDLYVSPDHAIAEGGVLIHAHLLQNGISIHQPNTETDIEYFHLEFHSHTILFAENLSTESFIDEGAGNRFQNAHTRSSSTPGQKPCLPRVFEGFHLHNIKSRIASRAGIRAPTTLGPLRGVIDECSPTLIRGWAQNSAAPEHSVTLEIISGSYKRVILANAFRPDLRAACLGSGCHGFSLTLPNLQHPVSICRLPDGATLPPPMIRHCESA